MHREISAGKAGTSGAPFPCKSSFSTSRKRCTVAGQTQEWGPAVLCTEDFPLRSILKNMEEAPKEMFKSTTNPSPSSWARKHVKQCFLGSERDTALMPLPWFLYLCEKQLTFFLAVFRNRLFRTFFRGRVTVTEETDCMCQADGLMGELCANSEKIPLGTETALKRAAPQARRGSGECPQ